MFAILKFFWILTRASWDIMNPNLNPMRYASPYVRYVASILLGCFRSLAFCLYVGELMLIGHNMLGHIAIISMVFVTWYTFKHFRLTYGPHMAPPLMRDPTGAPKCYEMTETETQQAMHRADQLLRKQV